METAGRGCDTAPEEEDPGGVAAVSEYPSGRQPPGDAETEGRGGGLGRRSVMLANRNVPMMGMA